MSKYSKEKLEEAVKQARNLSDVCRAFDLVPVGGNIGHMKSLIIKHNIDISHFTGRAHNRGKISTRKKKHKQVLINSDKPEKGWRLKRALLESGRTEKCEHCGTGTQWNGKKLVLVADHINGERSDHRSSNLQLLCPNCHSQTDTFAGRNKKI